MSLRCDVLYHIYGICVMRTSIRKTASPERFFRFPARTYAISERADFWSRPWWKFWPDLWFFLSLVLVEKILWKSVLILTRPSVGWHNVSGNVVYITKPYQRQTNAQQQHTRKAPTPTPQQDNRTTGKHAHANGRSYRKSIARHVSHYTPTGRTETAKTDNSTKRA